MFELLPFTNRGRMDLYRPFRDLEELERTFFSGSSVGFKTDIRDTGDAYVLEADLPGVKKEDIHIDIDGDCLSISAQRSSSHEEKDENGSYVRCERSYGSFSRSFDISGVRSEDLSAAYADGVLTVWVEDDFIRGMLEKPSVLDPLGREAARRANRTVQVFVKVGRPAATPTAPVSAPAEHDNLDDLLALGRQLDNIDIKE